MPKVQQTDLDRMVKFSEWLVEKMDTYSVFLGKLITSDEAHFCLNGYVNKQDMRFWAKDNPMEVFEVPLYSEKVTV